MQSSVFALSGALLLAIAPSAAHAQLKPEMQSGSMIPVKPKAVDPERAGHIRKNFARCVFRNAEPKAIALLLNSDAETVDLAAAKITKVSQDLSMDDCLGKEVGADQSALEMRFPAVALRDLLAEEAYLANNRKAPEIPPPPAVMPPLDARYVSTGEWLVKAQAKASFTDCAISEDVVDADALLRTTPGSRNERAAAMALGPSLGQCLEKGQNVALSPGSIRAFIAYAMWNRFGLKTAR